MRINTRNLRAKINNCLKSEQVQKKIQTVAKANPGVSAVSGWTLSEINSKIISFMEFFSEHLTVYFPGYYPRSRSGRMKDPNYLFGKTEITNVRYSPLNSNRIIGCTIKLYFNPTAIKRKSLNPQKYKPIKNILKLYSVGYDYRKPGFNYPYNTNISGTWRGETIFASTYMDSNPFMFNIIRAYNRTSHNSGIKAFLDSDYSHVSSPGITTTGGFSHIHIGFRV